MKTKEIIIGSLAGAGLIAAGAAMYYTMRSTIPEDAEPVKNFELEKYLGKWYEIARMNFMFEKHLNNTTAEYSLNEDGTVKVINSGYNYKKEKIEQSEGKAKFISTPDEARLKVSFFGPFYSGYNVIAIDKNYKYALVAGRNLDYMWILSRDTTIPENIKDSFLKKAEWIGYNTENLIWVEHDQKI